MLRWTTRIVNSKLMTTLRAQQISYSRSEIILFNNLSFALQAGELLQIAGPNGCGKTTLLRILCGLIAPSEGEIFWCNKSINQDRNAYLTTLIYLGHRVALKAGLTIYENLALVAAMANTQQMLSITDVLQQVGLIDQKNNFAHTLSAGQQRRVMLAKLLLIKTKLWILDEPFTALDQNGAALTELLLTTHVAQGGLAIITSHQPFELKNIKQQQLLLAGE